MSQSSTTPLLQRAAVLLCLGSAIFVMSCGSQGDVAVEAQKLIHAGQPAEAAQRLRSALESRPKDAALNRLLGIALIQSGQPSLAVWPLSRAAEDPSAGDEVQLLLARAMQRGGDAAGAIEVVSQLIEENPANVEALLIRAQSRVSTLEDEEAILDFEAVLDLDPDRIDLHLRLFNAHLKLENFIGASDALDQYEQALLAAKEPAQVAVLGGLCARRVEIHRALENTEEARAQLDQCLVEYSTQPTVLGIALQLLDEAKEGERATALLKDAARAEEDNFQLQLALARRFNNLERHDEAAEVLETAAERIDVPQVWTQLADHRMATGDPTGASEAIDRAIEAQLGSRPGEPGFSYAEIDDRLLFVHGDILVEIGELARTEEILRAIEEPAYRFLLDARIQLANRQFDAALDLYEKSFQLWHSNPGARYFAATAALELDRIDVAIQHLRESVRADAAATDAGFLLARIHDAQGDPAAAAAALKLHGGAHPEDADSIRMMARLFSRAELFEKAGTIRNVWNQISGQDGAVIADRVREINRIEGAEKALAFFEADDGPDLSQASKLEALVEWTQLMLGEGRSAAARQRVLELLESDAESPGLHALLGRILLAEGSTSDAEAALERALELEPSHLYAARELCILFLSRDDDVKRRAACDELARIAPETPIGIEARLGAVDRMIEAGATDLASEYLVDLLDSYPWRGDVALRIAQIQLRVGRVDQQTLSYAEHARQFPRHRSPEVLQTLGRVQLSLGLGREAIESFTRATETSPGDPVNWFLLGEAFIAENLRAEATTVYEGALARGPFPQEAAARERLQTLKGQASSAVEETLEKEVSGESRPPS